MSAGLSCPVDPVRKRASGKPKARLPLEQPDLPHALEYYQEIIRLHHDEERETGMVWRDYGAWIGLGTVLQEMGRKDEARAAFEEAVREADYPAFARKEAEAALAALNADSK